VVFLCFGADYANLAPRIPQIKHALALSDGALGVALLGAPAGTVCAVRVAGWAIGRWGSRRVTRCGALTMSGALVLPALAWNLGTLAAALVVLGAGLGLTDVAMNSQGVAVERALGRPIMSGLHGAYSVGSVLGALLGSTAAHLGVSTLAHFAVVAAALCLTAWFGSGALLHDDGPQPEREPDGRTHGRWSLTVVLLGVIGLCSFVGEGAVDNWSSVYLRDALGAGAGAAGLGFAGCAGAMAVVRLTGDRLVARFGRVAMLRIGALVSALGLGAGLWVGDQATAIVGFTAFGAGAALVAPVTFSAAGNLPGIPSGAAISYVTGIGYLGLLLGPPTIGFTAEAIGLRGALVIPAVLAAVIVVLAGAVRVRGRTGAPHPTAAPAPRHPEQPDPRP
jgi:MFS family permease